MKITNLSSKIININNPENPFKEGKIFKGQVMEVLKETILIDIKGYGTLKATSDIDMSGFEESEISFLVKSNKSDQIQLKPLIDNEILENTDKGLNNSMSKLFKKLNLQETKLSTDLVNNLMKYNVHINKENVSEGIKTLDKLIELIQLDNDEEVVLVKSEIVTGENEYIEGKSSDIIDSNKVSLKNHENMVDNRKVYIAPEKIDIKNLLVVKEKDNQIGEDLSYLIKEYLGEFSEKQISSKELEGFIKIISFLMKNDMDTSLNNIKNIKELNEDPVEFSKDFVKVDKLVENIKSDSKHIRNLNKGIELNIDEIEKDIKNLKEIGKSIDKLDKKTEESSNLKKEIAHLENKLDFLKEMNDELSFVFLPINYGEEKLNGVFTLLKDKKNKKHKNEELNVYINLDTNNLGNIKIHCSVKSEYLTVKINIKEKDLKLFQSMEKQLVDKISLIGYEINEINFVLDEDIQIIDTTITNPNPVYFLDIKV